MKSNNLVKNSIIYALGDIVPKFFNLITFPILTSHLSVEDYGIINYINSIELFLAIITFLCLKTYYLIHYFKVGDEYEQKKLLGNLTIVVIFVNVVISTFLLFCGGAIFQFVSGNISFYPYIALGILINFFSLFSQLPSALYRVQERPMPLTMLNILRGGLTMAGTWIFVVSYPTAESVLLIKLSVTFLFSIIFGWITITNAIFNFNFRQIIQALKFSLPLLPGDVAYYFSSMSDRVLIEKYSSLANLGVYSTAASLAGILNIVSYGAYKAFEPYFFKIYKKNAMFEKEFQRIKDTLFLVVVIGGMGLCLFSREFLFLFSSRDYYDAYLFVPLLILCIFIDVLTSLYATISVAGLKTKKVGLISILGAVLSVFINMLMMPCWGVWAATSSALIVSLFKYITLKKLSGLHTNSYKFVWILLLYILMCYVFVYNLENINLLLGILLKVIALISLTLIMMRINGVRFEQLKHIF